MKSILSFIVLCLSASTVFAQKVTYDLIGYAPPVAWQKEVKESTYVSYTSTNQQDGSYCQIFVLLGVNSKGGIAADFEHEWQNLILKQYKVTQAPQITETKAEDGWQAKAGVAPFAFGNGTSVVMLTTITGYGRTASIVALTNSQDYSPAIQDLLASVEMKKPAVGASVAANPAAKPTSKPTALQGYMDYSPFTKTWTWRLRQPPP